MIINIISLIVLLIAATAIFYICTVARRVFDKEERSLFPFEASNIKDDAVYNVQIDRLINKLKYDTRADKVFLCRFHNGGRFANGFAMKKFTMTNETHGSIAKCMRDRWRDVINSHYAEVIMQTLVLGVYIANAQDECTDFNFRQDMMIKNSFNSIYIYALKQFDGREEGFVGLCFADTKILTDEEKDRAEMALPELIGLINMKKSL
jgi:hypothetical protein